MFGTWISDVQRALSAIFPADKPYGAEDLKSTQMPSAIGHFLNHALKRRAARIEFSVESEWFDADASHVRSAFESYRQALTTTARYPQSVWESSLERGILFVVSYLVDPASGLVSFVFGDSEEPVPASRVTERLDYFGTHPALSEIIKTHLQSHRLNEIGPDDLRALVLKADRTFTEKFEPENWATHLFPLYEVAARLRKGEHVEAELPTTLLKIFFTVKGREEIVRRLEAVESVKGVHGLTADALCLAAGKQPEPQEPEPVEIQEEVGKRLPGTRVVRNDMHRGDKPSVVPRWMQFAGGNKPPENAPIAPARSKGTPLSVDDPVEAGASLAHDDSGLDVGGKIGQRAPVPDDLGMEPSGDGMQVAPPQIDDDPSNESVPRWTQFQATPASALPTSSESTDLEKRVIGQLNAVQRAWFINHLFGSDRERWKTVIALLSEANDWNEASEIIATEVFERQGVDIYSRPAVDFTNAVEMRFR